MHAAMEKNDFLILHDEFVEKKSNPMSWEETKIIIESKDELLYKLGRRPEDLEVYKVTCDKMKEDYVSVSEFLKIDKFGFDKEVDQETGKLQAVMPSNFGILKKLVLNDFPYNFTPGICHYVLWKMASTGRESGRVDEGDLNEAIEELRGRGDGDEFLWWINPENLKSILDIDHAHIVCRKTIL